MTKLEALMQLRGKVKAGDDIFPSDFPADFKGVPWGIRAFEGSLDAAKALHESVLPRWGCNIGLDGVVAVWFQNGPTYVGRTDTPARAWLLAILEALISQETGA